MFVIVNKETNARFAPGRTYKTLAAAKAAVTRRTLGDRFEAVSYQEWQERDTDVEVINLMSGKPARIRRSEVGGPCDPSTERYWSM